MTEAMLEPASQAAPEWGKRVTWGCRELVPSKWGRKGRPKFGTQTHR